MTKLSRWIDKTVNLIQYTIIGIVSGIDAKANDNLHIPSLLLTKRGIIAGLSMIAVIVAVNAVMIITEGILVALSYVLLVITKSEAYKDDSFVLKDFGFKELGNVKFVKQNFGDVDKWFEKQGIMPHEPTFYEELIFFDMFYKWKKFSIRRGWSKDMPPELEEKYQDARRNFMIYNLSGLDE